MYVFFSTALLCALLIAVSDSKAIESLVRSRRQTNNIQSKTRTQHRSQRQIFDSSDTDFVFKGTSDFAYKGEIARPNFGKNTHSQMKSAKPNSISSSRNFSYEDDSIVFFDNTREQIRNAPTSTTATSTTATSTSTTTTSTSTTTTSTTVRPRAREPNACQLMCHRRITNEYNPRCGSDGITYYNPGKLECAKRCGKEIIRFTYSSCGAGARVI